MRGVNEEQEEYSTIRKEGDDTKIENKINLKDLQAAINAKQAEVTSQNNSEITDFPI